VVCTVLQSTGLVSRHKTAAQQQQVLQQQLVKAQHMHGKEWKQECKLDVQ